VALRESSWLRDVETGSKNDVALDGNAAHFHLAVERGIADDASAITKLSAQLIQPRHTAHNRSFLNQCELANLAERDL
jgi:hypothetical protein